MTSLSSSLTLPSGLVLPNRLSKAAMAEDLADTGAQPGTALNKVYNLWSSGSWGMLLTGNVMIDSSQKGSPNDVALPSSLLNSSSTSPSEEYTTTLALWTTWAKTIQADSTPAIMQINHPGRQALRFTRKGPALAPSAIGMNLGEGLIARFLAYVAFGGAPRAMTKADIEDVVKRFAATAKLAAEAGFKGVEIHAAHGYLLSQFLSKKTNNRTDEYGGNAFNRARLLREVVSAIREGVPRGFTVGIKLNSADFGGEDTLEEVLEQIGSLVDVEGGVDFLEVSGGSYEDPRMAGPEYSTTTPTGDAPASTRTARREAFFLSFASSVRSRYPSLPLMVTGGFRTRAGMISALESGACDIIGLGRPAVVTPDLPRRMLLVKGEGDVRVPMKEVESKWGGVIAKWLGVRMLGGGLVTAAYQMDLKKLVH